MSCKNCLTALQNDILITCGDCALYLCKNCSKQCQNKNYSHVNINFCNLCFAVCSLCREMKQCRMCTKKCFYKNCSNLICNTCYDRNKHQLRPENTNCKFYKCDGCQTDANCIMTTVYCQKCDRRVCTNCFHNDHKAHNK